MIQIDMPMPEKCSDCIFCDDNCSCVASDYDGLGINVGCAYRTGRRDIRCPLKEQDPVEPELEGGGSTWWNVCGECHGAIDVSDNFCKHCGRRIRHEKKAE